VALGADNFGKLLAEAANYFLCVVKAQRRLSKEGEAIGVVNFELVDGSDRIDHDGAIRSLAGSAHDFLVVLVADKNDGALFAGEFQRFQVHLGDERAGRVDHFEGALLGFVTNGGRNAVSAEHQDRAVGHVFDGLDENRAAATQLFHNVRVMNDFVVNVNGSAVGLERQFDDIDSANDAGAEPTRPDAQQYLSICFGLHLYPN